MAAQQLKLQPFQNVQSTGLASTDLSHLFGYALRRIKLQLGGTTFTKSMITGIQLIANSKVIFDTTGPALDATQLYRGISGSASFLTVDLLELKSRSKLGLEMGALDTTIGVKSLRLEIKIAGAAAPTLAGICEISTPQVGTEFAKLRPLIARRHRLVQTIGAGGQDIALTIPHADPNGGGSIFRRINIFSSNITGAYVLLNGVKQWEETSVASNNYTQGEYDKVPQAGLFVIDPTISNIIEGRALDTRPASGCTTFQVFGNFSAGETITVEAETLEPLDAY